MNDLLRAIEGGLIVSCQAPEGNPLRSPEIMAAMARAAIESGAAGIRANAPDHVAAIRRCVSAPIIGLNKVAFSGSEAFITPTVATALPLIDAGASVVATDGTERRRPGDESLSEIVAAVHERGCLVMADCSTAEEGIFAAEAGADWIGTTLSGYTPYSRNLDGPDFELISELAAALHKPIIAEGRFWKPEEAREALDRGAHAVVIGSAITRPDLIAERFLRDMKKEKKR